MCIRDSATVEGQQEAEKVARLAATHGNGRDEISFASDLRPGSSAYGWRLETCLRGELTENITDIRMMKAHRDAALAAKLEAEQAARVAQEALRALEAEAAAEKARLLAELEEERQLREMMKASLEAVIVVRDGVIDSRDVELGELRVEMASIVSENELAMAVKVAEVHALEGEVAALKDQFAKELECLEDENEVLRAQIQEAKDQARRQREALEARVAAIEQEHKEQLAENQRKFDQTKASMQASIDAVNAALEALKVDHSTELQALVARHQEELSPLQAQIKELQRKLSATETKLAHRDTEVSKLKDLVRTMNEDFDAREAVTQKQHEANIQTMKDSIAELEQSYQLKIDLLTQEKIQLSELLEGLRARVAELEGQLAESGNEVLGLTQELESLNAKIAAWRASLMNLGKVLEKARRETERSRTKACELPAVYVVHAMQPLVQKRVDEAFEHWDGVYDILTRALDTNVLN
eukprot:TRINITY_DN27802_c0_g1_i1.p1 TRINITY_DN27802_c0_g1~~TRINITY_DN27802_c0_g1_i1.p1  ORF type:complete len:472 (+),score=186.16 TRINITY_DN27802_c0_g1_i1:117-1532(+)